MHLVYENTKEEIIAIKKTPVHRPPHLHNALEIVYVTEGCVELGVGEELFHMDQGDIGPGVSADYPGKMYPEISAG